MASDAAEFVDLVGQFNARRRRARSRALAYPIYIAVLVALIYGGSAIVRAARSLRATHHLDPTTLRIEAAAPFGLVALTLILLSALSRQALWRGPVVLSEADAAWLLPLPISRRRMLLPRYVSSGIFAVFVALVIGAVGAVVLHAYALGSIGRLLTICLIYAVAIALLSLGGAAVIEASPAVAAKVRRGRGPTIVLAGAFAALAGYDASRSPRSSAPRIAHLFGPWAWAGSGAVALAAAAYGVAVAPQVSSIALRQRAAVGSAVSTSTQAVDLRQARLAVNAATGGRRRGFRLRAPRRSSWSIPWRDLSNVLTAPGGFGWAAVWIALGAAAFATAGRQPTDSRHELFPLTLAMLCGYLAALPYTEPTRLDADDLRRVRWSPYPIRSLTARHAIVPAALTVTGQLIGAAVALTWLGGRGEMLALCLAVTTGPVLAVAGMISAYRGSVPLQWVFAGPDIGFGPIGAPLVVFWYLLGPIAALVLGAVTALPILHAYHSGSPVAGAAIGALIVSGGATGLLVVGAQQRAQRRLTR